MKTKACALLIAIIMLFSFVCSAENGYVTISDPYYTDGEKVYDLTGLSANLSYAKAENVVQVILRAITAYEQKAAGIEIENDIVSLYADGFTGRYTMSLNDFMMLLKEATDGDVDISYVVQGLMTENELAVTQESISLASLVSEVYALLYGDGSQLTDAKKDTVSTFLHADMSSFAVKIDKSAEELDQLISGFCSQIDAQGIVSEEVLKLLSGENDVSGMTALSLYEERVKPLGLNVKGNTYYGENDIFVEWSLCAGEKVLLPVFLELTNTETPSLYMNIHVDDGYGGKLVLYATAESSLDGKKDYLEIGVLEDDRTIALVTYQEYENAGMPVQDFYIGVTEGNALYNFSLVNSTDHETARSIHASAYLDGIEVQLSYNGVISSDYGDKNEQGIILVATNVGIQAKVNVGFGTGSGAPAEFIPSEIPQRDIITMIETENEMLMLDFSNFLNALSASLIMGVPGIAQLVGMDGAEG